MTQAPVPHLTLEAPSRGSTPRTTVASSSIRIAAARGPAAALITCAPVAPPRGAFAPAPRSRRRHPTPVDLTGIWGGDYAVRRYRCSGPIRVELVAGEAPGTLRGGVCLGGVRRTRHTGAFGLTLAERPGAGTDEVAIDSVRATPSGMELWLAPCEDSGCECGSMLTLRARVRGDALAETLRAETGSLLAGGRGRWRAVRRVR